MLDASHFGERIDDRRVGDGWRQSCLSGAIA
jgi:hypothetical protein